MTDKTPDPCGSDSSEQLGQPIAYLYHDANTPKDAHPWLHSTMLVLAADRRQGLRGETPLVTLEQAKAMVAAERERWSEVVFDGWRVLQGLDERAQKRTSHQNVSDTLDALVRVMKPNTEGKRPAQGTEAGPV